MSEIPNRDPEQQPRGDQPTGENLWPKTPQEIQTEKLIAGLEAKNQRSELENMQLQIYKDTLRDLEEIRGLDPHKLGQEAMDRVDEDIKRLSGNKQ